MNLKGSVQKSKKLIRAHHGHHIDCLSKKRSQLQLQRLVDGVGLVAAQHISSEDNSNVNIINDEEIPNMKKDHTSPAKKQIQLHANVVKGNNVRIEGSSNRNSPVHFNGNKEPDVENKRKETEQLQRNEKNKSKRHMDASKGYASVDNKQPEVSKSNIVVPTTSMAGHAVDEFVDQIELDEKTETFETTAVVQNGLPFPLPPLLPRNYFIQVRKTAMTSFSSRRRKRSCPNFSILPRDLTVNILSKLPCISILRCKVVCKEWFNIITSYSIFAKRHYENNFTSLLCQYAIIDGYKTKSKNEQRGWSYKIDVRRFDFNIKFEVANSCKGFLLMQERDAYHKELKTFYVRNPVTNETLSIPKLPKDKHVTTFCGLGFGPVMKKFKVVVFSRHSRRDILISLHIYTLEDGSAWRTVSLPEGGCNGLIYRRFINSPIYLNGFLHWKTTTDTIACFNMEKEELSEMCTPSVQEKHYMDDMWECKGLLYIGIPIYRKNRSETEIWVMKEYGVKESWMRFVVVKHVLASNSIRRVFTLHRPKLVDILDTGELIFVSFDSDHYHLLSYDAINECFEKLPFPNKYFKLYIYSLSFFWLKDFGNPLKRRSSVASFLAY